MVKKVSATAYLVEDLPAKRKKKQFRRFILVCVKSVVEEEDSDIEEENSDSEEGSAVIKNTLSQKKIFLQLLCQRQCVKRTSQKSSRKNWKGRDPVDKLAHHVGTTTWNDINHGLTCVYCAF